MDPLTQLQSLTVEADAYRHVWKAIVRACEDGLSDPRYPADRRYALYDLLGAARECAEPDALPRLRRAHRPAARR